MKSPDKRDPPVRDPAVVVVKAETHNLKSVSCRVPHGQVTVVTGPSGAGKSSLAFDTIYAEGQRRFVESMSTYARQFLEKMERPPVESIEGVLPTVALEARNSVKNARSTVGTLTEVQDVLRLLFTHLGVQHCPNGHGPVTLWSPTAVAHHLGEQPEDTSMTLVVQVKRPAKKADETLSELIRQGYGRILDAKGAMQRLDPEAENKWPKKLDPLPVVVGRFKPSVGSGRLQEAIEQAFQFRSSVLEVQYSPAGDDGQARVETFRPGLACEVCGESLRQPTPALFSFNSPLGACEECQGFGRVMGIDRRRVIPNRSLTLLERPIAPWNSPAYEDRYEGLFAACREAGIPLEVPVAELDDQAFEFLWSGGGFTNLQRFFTWLERRSYRMHVRVLLSRYRAYEPCPTCGGSRLVDQARHVLFQGETIFRLSAMTIDDLAAWLGDQEWSERQRETAGEMLDKLANRISVLRRVGVGYLTLDRQARTLSGGETQRLHLASALGSGLTSTLYVLDEPTIGLHTRDSVALLELLHDLADHGNTVLVVEHDPVLIRGADWLIDLGPEAGEQGGELMSEGVPADVLADEGSLTARFLGPGSELARAAQRDAVLPDDELEALQRIEIVGARQNNLRDISVVFPVGAMVAVTGVSGSGKSTLIDNVLHASYKREHGVVDVEPGECDELRGVDLLEDIVLVDQRPLGRSSRSNPVTYIKAYDELRKLYADQPVAKRDGIGPGHFSFNTDKGRCPECEGRGTQEIDMHFMAPVQVVCDACEGRRFKDSVLKVRYQGLDIHQALDLTVDRAKKFFAERRPLVRKLDALSRVGLGYIRLGQSTATLSGGEAQRLKLASFLGSRKAEKPRLFLFDEPTTGLHVSDIDRLYGAFQQLIERGDGVLFIEHNLDLVARADWIVDLGPEGGDGGGEVLYSGPFAGFLAVTRSPTADALRSYLDE
jgi:excinuclease ABC subunit A